MWRGLSVRRVPHQISVQARCAQEAPLVVFVPRTRIAPARQRVGAPRRAYSHRNPAVFPPPAWLFGAIIDS